MEDYEQLKHVSTYNELKQIFNEADKKYNSGLFTFIENNEIEISFGFFSEIYQDLYYPNSSYEFSVIPSHILARVYDVFLSEKIIIDKEDVKVKTKPEAKDSLGAISTPKAYADTIVNESIELRLSNSKIDVPIKVVDICCGSGVFLVSTYENLVNRKTIELMTELEENISDGTIIGTSNGNYRISFELKRQILLDSIYGIDIDSSAVEVCKFSLLLACISDLTVNERDYYIDKGGLLPNLDRNIINGNSLVSDNFYQFMEQEELSLDADFIFKEINPVNIEKEFDGFDKFDVIVGNPPYIRVQKMAKYAYEEYQYLKSSFSGFKLNRISALDKYYLFLERALQYLDTNGVCGYIISNKFIHEKNGKYLRSYISKNRLLKKLINFNEIQVFTWDHNNGWKIFCDEIW